jgi:Bifunctional DNA primase/polymerase, N-terminal
MTALLTAALSYARRGWAVLPLHSVGASGCSCRQGVGCPDAGKHPRFDRVTIANGLSDATVETSIISKWWRRWPAANIGIATGAASGFFVLDVDPRHGGDDALADLERLHGALPDTVASLTGRNGRHLLFMHPGSTISNKAGIAPGLDVRGDGGYIVAPPSTTAGPYVWEVSQHPDDVPLAPAPAWLLDLLTGRRGRLRRDETPLTITAGTRNTTLARFAGLLRRYGLCEAAVGESLLAINRHHCQPALADCEALAIAHSVAGYPVRQLAAGGQHGPRISVTVKVK